MNAILRKPHTQKDRQPFSFKRQWNKVLATLQRVGKSLMFPIALLPIAALLLRIGYLIQDPSANGSMGIDPAQVFIGKLISTPGGVVFDNLPIIFAIGIAFGLANDNRGEAALVGAILWYGMNALLRQGMLAEQIYENVLTTSMVTDSQGNTSELSQLLYFLKAGIAQYQLDAGVFGGIISGAIVAKLYNKYRHIKLHQALSFFGGRRFIPMLGVLAIIPLALAIALVWPWIQFILIKVGTALSESQGAARGAASGAYAILNRLLQPFGLHHIINTFVWFQLPVTGANYATGVVSTVNGDITAFNNGIIGSGLFTTGFFPLFLGGLVGAAVAMIMTSDKEKRRRMMFFYGGTGFVAFVTGIDEPLIFSFIFVSPLLYGLNALFTGIFSAGVAATGMSLGIGFSAGFIDYIVSFPVSWGMANIVGVVANPLWIWPFAIVMGVLYYFVFYFVIKRFKVPTPGREIQLGLPEAELNADAFDRDEPTKDKKTKLPSDSQFKDKYDAMAANILDIVGVENVVFAENCATRLRLTVKDNKNIDDAKLKAIGVKGIVRLGDEGFQAIIGTDVEHVADYFKTRMVTKNEGFHKKEVVASQPTASAEVKDLVNSVKIHSPINGHILSLKDLNDGVFSEGILGKGFVVDTSAHAGKLEVRAPISGTLDVVFPTSHAFGITNENGVKVLIHIGLDTVKLNGEGFTPKVKQNQAVKAGEVLVTMDLDLIKSKGYKSDIIVVILEESTHKNIVKQNFAGIKAGTVVLEVK